MSSKKNFQVAFDPITGSHQAQPKKVTDELGRWQPPTMVDRFFFESSMCYVGHRRNTHGIPSFIFEDNEERQFSMFIADFDKAIPYMVGGRLTGTFGFTKRGNSTGITFDAPELKTR